MSDNNIDKRQFTMTDKQIVVRLLSYAIPYIPKFLVTLGLMLFSVLAGLLEPFLTGKSIDLIKEDVIDFNVLYLYLGIFIIAILVGNILNYAQTIILQKTGQSIIYNIREEIFTHLEFHDVAYLNKTPTGALVTRVTNDTNTLSEMYTNVIVSVFRNVIMVVLIFVAMFFINVKLTLLILIVVPFIVFFSFLFRRYSRKAYRMVRANLSKVNAFLAEHLSGMKIIQIFNQEDEKFIEFDERNTKLKKSYYRQIFVFGLYRPTMYFLYMIALVIVFYYGGISVIDGIITVGVLITFQNYIGRFFEPIQQLAEQFNTLQSAFASAERLFGILDSKPTISDIDDPIELTDMTGEIEFKNVWFAYNDEEWILKDISFKVKAKESVAFIGATGAGKTTILRLITRNYDIQKGQIFVDGIDIMAISKATLRKYIGVMLQDVFMFSGTIESNIKLRDDSISDEKMIQSCKYVNADSFIDKLQDGYKERVKERGNNFSTGQRQLLSFARTIVHDPKVMILDEATSNIDTETEQLIQDSLKKMMSIGTMLIVAHRLSTVSHVSCIYLLDKGRIIEQGNHQELLKKRGKYYKLYELQKDNEF